ncbi:MAG: hypothetical protein ABII12_06785 [Planctomycetota bacterium]
MKTATTHALETESAFLSGVLPKLRFAGSRFIAGAWFDEPQEHDNGEQIRATMADRRIYDRDRYAAMPHGKGFTIRGFERRWLLWKKLKSVTVASVLVPPGPLLESDEPAPPVTFAELKAHVDKLVEHGKAPHLIGICSPSGFEEEVWNLAIDMPNVKLVLIEPGDEGGWRVRSPGGALDPRLCGLFDPEDVPRKITRVYREIEERSTDLLTGGLTARSIAEKLDLPALLVAEAIAQKAKADPELHVSRRSGELILYRGAPALSDKEDNSMSLSEWIRRLFSKEGEEAKKINVLAERRAALSTRLDRLYEDIGKLETKEQGLHEEGKASSSKVAKRRIAAQISHLRKDISRVNTSAAMLGKQINIISTHIHNLELAQTGSVAQLPSSEDLTEAAVNAEEILEQLSASDELVSSLEIGMAESAISDDEAAILKELEGDDGEAAQPRSTDTAAAQADAQTEPPRTEHGEAQAE